MASENIIDLGKVKVPTSWDEVTLKQYQEIEKYYDGRNEGFKLTDILHIMCDKTVDEINSMPLEFLDIISSKLSFMTTPMEEAKPSKSIEINGEIYSINIEEKLKVGEYVAADTILKEDRHNYAAILAILCRKKGELYDSHFENEVIMERVKMFENQPLKKIMGLVSFFLNCYTLLAVTIQLSSEVQEGIEFTRKDIETLRRNGEITKRSSKSLMKKLKKLEQSINSI